MDIGHYQRFLAYQQQGLKKPATEAVRQFIDSFENDAEKAEWVWSHLPQLYSDGQDRIRHELFNELIFPLLHKGWKNDDWQSMLWLGKLIQNIYQASALHRALNFVTDRQLFQRCYQLQPEHSEVREHLLASVIRELSFCGHEYPPVILSGNHAADQSDCALIQQDIELARTLDQHNRYREFLDAMSDDLLQYQASLAAPKGNG